jgi:hypothetical protein
MCRNIKTLYNFAPPATDGEVRAASLQFVRKLSGYNAPSKSNEAAFNDAVEEVFAAARKLIDSLETTAAPRDREVEAEKARRRSAERFGKPVAD